MPGLDFGTFGTFGTFGLDFGDDLGSQPSTTTTTTTTTTFPDYGSMDIGFFSIGNFMIRKRRSTSGEPLVSTVLKDCYVTTFHPFPIENPPQTNPQQSSILDVYIGENTQSSFRKHVGQFLPTTGDHKRFGHILKGAPVYCLYGGLPVLYGLHQGYLETNTRKVIHNLDNQLAWLRRAILHVDEPEFSTYSKNFNQTSHLSAGAFKMNFRQFDTADCKEGKHDTR